VLEATQRTLRLELEPLVLAHADELFEPLSHASLYLYVPRAPFASLRELARRIERLRPRRSPDGADFWLNWVMRAGGGPVGMLEATVHPASRAAEIAYTTFVPAQRRGFATEAVGWLLPWLTSEMGVRRFRATVDTRNAASIALLRRFRFERIDTSPAGELILGQPADEHLFELAV
jgi:RimJ/RimL family protein N-acetyltransferase